MSTLLLMILRLLHNAGVPVEVCADHTVSIGGHCNVRPPPPQLVQSDAETTISNGF